MIVYHGSNVEVHNPQILTPNRALDFGAGFYTTLNRDQATDFANKVFLRLGVGNPVLNTYEIDEQMAFPLCSVLRFDAPNDAWLDFVCDNRDGTYYGPQYDFKFGPVANDDVYRTLALYRGGQLSREDTLKQLKIKTLYNQLVFATAKALSFIRFMYSEVVS